jgi:GTPase SAR1 family protein
MRIDLNAVRASLMEMYSCLRTVVDEITQDHKKLAVCSRYPDFQKESPAAWLEQAGKRLSKKEYRIAFVGPFKAGKSTFLSALFRQPEMLPAQDRECTFAVSVVTTPPPGTNEHVKVTYYTSEEALRNVLDNTAYAKLFEQKKAERDEILKSFAADHATEFIRECAEKNKGGDLRTEAAQLLDFLKCYRDFRDRLGKDHIDGIDQLDTYVRKPDDTRIGHLLLIKMVLIVRHNEVLQQNSFQIADTPGIDSLNQAARDITFNYLRDSDAVVYVADAKGLTDKFQEVRNHLGSFQNDVRNKMFIVANRADWYDAKSMKRERGEKPQIEGIFEDIAGKLHALGINESRLHFTCGRVSELATKKEKGGLNDEERLRYNELRSALDERLHALDADLNPFLRDQLVACFKDGGVDNFRASLVQYLQYDIQVERLKEVFIDLSRVHASLSKLLEPEQIRLKGILASIKPRSQQVTEFFDQLRDQFLDKIAPLNVGAPRATGALMATAREQVARAVENAVDRLNIDRVRTRLRVPTPVNIKTEVIAYFKTDLSAKFTQIVREVVCPAVRAKLAEQIAASRAAEVLQYLAKGYGADFDAKFQNLMDSFYGGFDHFTEMRAREETWDLQDAEMKPPSFETEWDEKVEAQFRTDLKKVFTERFTFYGGKLNSVLARHYQGLFQDLGRDFEKLLEEVADAVKRDPDRVQLPAKLLTGQDQETEEERRQHCLLSYFRQHDTIRKLHDDLSPNFAAKEK